MYLNRPTSIVIFLCILSHVALLTIASAGDRSTPFQQCLYLCKLRNCSSQDAQPAGHLPFSLRLTRWTCSDDCSYSCMHQITDSAITQGHPVLQYYGKWPFWRLFGMQEPASVLFSLLNFWVHLRGYKATSRSVSDGHPMKRFIILYSIVSMNAWIWSAIFHTRDRPITEKLDYFSAAVVFIVALHSVSSRFFFVGRPSRRALYRIWTGTCIAAYILHVSYLSLLPRFDYSYNIIFNLVIGLSHNLLWSLYSLPETFSIMRRFPPNATPRNYRPRCASQAALGVALTMVAMSLELLDFPPFARVLDAHALWHAATVPIAALWYSFLITDALDEGWKAERF